MSRKLVGIGAAAALLFVGWLTVHLHDKHVAEMAIAHQTIAADSARADSAAHRAAMFAAGEALWHARADSLAALRARDSLRLDSLSRRITITAPGMIAIASNAGANLLHSPAPVVTVTVPREITDYVQALRTRNATLERSLAVADSGWAAADSVAAARAKQIRALNDQVATLAQMKTPRFGLKTGALLGVLASAGAVWAAGRLR